MKADPKPALFKGRAEAKSLAHQQVRDTPTGALRASPNNARVHSQRQIELLARSITRFGFNNPILTDADNRVIAGWGRVQAAKKLGLSSVPTLKIEYLNQDELRAYVIADNRLAQKAEWDRALLAVELEGLTELGIDTEAIGFETAEIDIIIEEAAEAKDPSPDDELPALQVATITRAGDLWCCGEHRLLCADATQSTSYGQLLGEEKATFVTTDPPYNLKIDGHVSGLGKKRHREFAMASGEMTSPEFCKFLEQAFTNMAAYSLDGSIHQTFMDWRHSSEILAAGKCVYHKLLNICVWCKTNAGMGSLYRSQHELVFVWLKGSSPHINNIELGRHGRSRSNVWTYAGVNTFKAGRDEELGMHPTVKPVALVADAIKDCTQRGAIILDPFVGSGTTLIAAEKTGRKARAIELDRHYVDVAVRRWQTYSGKPAIHTETGMTFEQVEKRRFRVPLKMRTE